MEEALFQSKKRGNLKDTHKDGGSEAEKVQWISFDNKIFRRKYCK